MGQRAALLLSELLLLLTASCTLLAVSFPEDSAPLEVVDAHCEYPDVSEPGGDANAASQGTETLSSFVHTQTRAHTHS